MITYRLSGIENSLSTIQTEICSRLEVEVEKVKYVIKAQQMQIEAEERKIKDKNIIAHNVSETNLSTATEKLKEDFEVRFLYRSRDLDIKENDIGPLRRLGRTNSDKIWPLKIELKNVDSKFKIP